MSSQYPSLQCTYLSKLTTDSTSDVLDGVRISEEAAGVCDDLPDMEASTVVDASGVVGTSHEGSRQAAVGHTAVIRSLGIGESEARRTGRTLLRLVNMCGSNSRGLVVTGDTAECDV